MKRMQTLAALLLACLVLLAGCGKKNADAEGSGSAAAETTQTDKKTGKSTKSDQSGKDGAAGQQDGKAAAATTAPGKSGGTTAAQTTPNLVQSVTDVKDGESGTWADVEQAQSDLIGNLPISIVGNWQDSVSQRATLLIDEQGTATILWSQDASTTYFWIFTVDVNGDTGEMRYSDCVKQIQANNEAPRVLYQNGTGKLTLKDGSLYWLDDIENAGAQCVFVKTDR